MSLVDVLIGAFLLLVIFLALFGLMRASVVLSSLSKNSSGRDRGREQSMEYLRSLSYDNVGTVGGIPAGVVSESTTTVENGITYSVRTFIAYVDDPANSTGSDDANGITTDYKRVKVAVTYPFRGVTKELDLVENVAPPGVETSTGGGTLRIVAVNASGDPVSGATVQVVNTSVSPQVNVTAFTDSDGIVLLSGAATSTGTQVTVTKTGYSSAQTYARDATNQNPTPGYLTVVANETTTDLHRRRPPRYAHHRDLSAGDKRPVPRHVQRHEPARRVLERRGRRWRARAFRRRRQLRRERLGRFRGRDAGRAHWLADRKLDHGDLDLDHGARPRARRQRRAGAR